MVRHAPAVSCFESPTCNDVCAASTSAVDDSSGPCFHDTMFSRIRANSTTLLRRVQHVRYPIASSTHVLSGIRHNHTPDSYSKDVDHTPPNDKKVHRVDPNSECVQKPYEAPSGEWSRAGVKAEEYRAVEEKRAYAPKGGESTRYGVRKKLTEDKGTETSKK